MVSCPCYPQAMPMPLNECPKCGAEKQDKYDLCRDCAKEKAAAEGRLCRELKVGGAECGNFKKAEFPQCIECAREIAAKEGRMCECGGFKSPRFPKCRKCTETPK